MSYVSIVFSPCRNSLSPMSHVELEKCPYLHVDLGVKGHLCLSGKKTGGGGGGASPPHLTPDLWARDLGMHLY